jgi:hypothetical protein
MRKNKSNRRRQVGCVLPGCVVTVFGILFGVAILENALNSATHTSVSQADAHATAALVLPAFNQEVVLGALASWIQTDGSGHVASVFDLTEGMTSDQAAKVLKRMSNVQGTDNTAQGGGLTVVAREFRLEVRFTAGKLSGVTWAATNSNALPNEPTLSKLIGATPITTGTTLKYPNVVATLSNGYVDTMVFFGS